MPIVLEGSQEAEIHVHAIHDATAVMDIKKSAKNGEMVRRGRLRGLAIRPQQKANDDVLHYGTGILQDNGKGPRPDAALR